MDEALKQKTTASIAYNGLAAIVAFVLQFFSNIVLSQKLSASDFGLVGFAYIFINFLARFEDLGLNRALIRRDEIDERVTGTALTTKTVISSSLFIVSVVLAPFAQYLFDNPKIVIVIRLLSLNYLINILSFIPSSLLTRELNFKKINIAKVSSRLANSIITIVLALSGFNYLSIVIGNIAATLILAISLNLFLPTKIRYYFNRGVFLELVSFGWKVTASGLVIFIVFNIDNFVIGIISGSVLLGYYVIAFNWGSMICALLSSVVLEVLFPTYSKLKNSRESLRAAYLKTLEIISFLAVIANLTLFLVSDGFLFHILGKGTAKWMPAAEALRVLCLYGIIRSLLEPIGNIILALGRPGIILRANMFASGIEVLLIYPVARYTGIVGVAILVTAAYCAQYVFFKEFIINELGISYRELNKVLRSPLISALALFPAYKIIHSITKDFGMLSVPVEVLFCVGFFILVHGVLTKWKLHREVGYLAKAVLIRKGK